MDDTSKTGREGPTRFLFPAIIAVTCGYVLLALTYFNKPNPIDDAYITFAYAKSLLAGQGLTFPPDERIFGSTTPLYVLLLALFSLGAAPDAIPGVAVFINALALCGTAFLSYLVLVEMDSRHRLLGALVAVLVLLNTKLQVACLGGMESILLAFLILLSFWTWLKKRDVVTGVILGLAALTRPEGVLAGLTLVILSIGRTRGIPWRLIAAAAVTVIPWVIFATVWFGSPIPHNLIVKSEAFHHYDGHPGTTLRILLSDLPELFGMPLVDRAAAATSVLQAPSVILGALLLAGAAVLFAVENSPSLLFSLTILFYLAFHGIGNKLCFGWYSIPPLPLYLAVSAGGLDSLLRRISRRLRGRETVRVVGLIAGFVILLAGSVPRNRDLGTRYVSVLQGAPSREHLYREAAQLLNSRSGVRETVALPEVGTFAFYSNHRCIDLVGLVNRDVLPLRLEGQDYWEIARHFQPRWIVTHAAFASPFTASPSFNEEYELEVRSGPISIFGRRAVTPSH